MGYNKEKFDGVFTALLTPFDKENKINEKALRELVALNLKMGVKGFYVCGSTGEAFLMSKDERARVMEIVKSEAGDATLIAHIGSVNEMEATALAKHAKALEYDLVSSVAPFYYKFSFEEIKGYYCRLADAAELPMLVYHIPVLSGVNMGVNDLGAFLNDDRFIGIKYTSNDFFMMEQCKTAFPEKVLYNGYDEMFLAGLSMGADGAIGSTYNFMANKFVRIRQLFNAGNITEAQRVQKEANRIIAILCRLGVHRSEKEIMNQMGLDFGACRPPFGALSSEDKALIKKEILPFI